MHRKKQIVTKQNGEIVVDWKRFSEVYKTAREGTYVSRLRSDMLGYLVDLGILTAQPDGFQLTAPGPISLNPRLNILELYFKRIDDARQFRDLNFSRAQYPISIQKISEVK